jgi:hypothetical protein
MAKEQLDHEIGHCMAARFERGARILRTASTVSGHAP